MGRRADALSELRALDERLAAVAPGPHLEGRILARIRGEKAPRAARAGFGRGLERAKRPALVLSFGLATALAVMLSLEARVSGPGPRSAEVGAQEPEGSNTSDPAAGEPAEREDLDAAPAAPAGREKNEGPERPLFYEKEMPRRQDGPTREAPPKTDTKNNTPQIPLDWGSIREAEDFDFAPPSAPARSVEPRRGPAARPSLQNPLPGSSFGPMRFAGEKEEPRRIRVSGSLRSEPSGGSPPSDSDVPIANSAPPAPPEEVAEEVCQSATTLKLMASAECESEGLVLSSLTLLAPCGGDMFGGAEAECSKPANEVNEEEAYCEGLLVGDGTSCEPPEHWKKLAYDACLGEGLNLVDLFYHQDCSEGKSSLAKVLCCTNVPPPEPDPPPSSPCVTVEIFPACTPPPEVEAEAKKQCFEQGMGLSWFKLVPDCDGGGVSHAAFQCCP